jgi:hypothetical protein
MMFVSVGRGEEVIGIRCGYNIVDGESYSPPLGYPSNTTSVGYADGMDFVARLEHAHSVPIPFANVLPAEDDVFSIVVVQRSLGKSVRLHGTDREGPPTQVVRP